MCPLQSALEQSFGDPLFSGKSHKCLQKDLYLLYVNYRSKITWAYRKELVSLIINIPVKQRKCVQFWRKHRKKEVNLQISRPTTKWHCIWLNSECNDSKPTFTPHTMASKARKKVRILANWNVFEGILWDVSTLDKGSPSWKSKVGARNRL